MVKEAEEHAEEDRKKRELVDAKNQAESLIHTTEKTLNEVGDQVDANDKQTVETAVSELRTALEGEDLDDIKQKTEALSQASSKLGEAMYRNAQENQGAEGAAGDGAQASGGDGQQSGEDVVDADFEEVDDNDQKRGGQSK
jgi:molecular chaperone DnaK